MMEKDKFVYECFDCVVQQTVSSYENLKCPDCGSKKFLLLSHSNGTNPPHRLGFDDNAKNAMKIFADKMELANLFYDKQPIFYDKAGLFWLWDLDTKAWVMKDETDITNILYSICNANTINSKERNEILQALKQIGRMYMPIPLPNTWIQFKNGLIDINNEYLLKESTYKYFTVNPIPWKIGTTDETPNMDRIFEEWVGKEHVKKLYQIIAYSLLPSYPIHRLFCFIGEGMNGKSKYLELLRKFIGEDNCCTTELDTLLNSRFEVTRLHKKLICQMGETNFNEMKKTSILKKLTGGTDLIGFEYKGKTPFQDKNYSKIIISTNNLPTTSDKTIGFYRRWLIIDFPNRFTEKKDILSEIPSIEFENLAYKSIKILKDLLIQKEFDNEGSIEDRIKRYEDHSDPLEKFIKEFTNEDSDGHIWKFDFEKKLNDWCKANKFRQFSEVVIGKKMKERGVFQELKTSSWLIDGSKKPLRAWMGMSWKAESSVNTEIRQDKQDKQVNPTQFSHRDSEWTLPVNLVNLVKYPKTSESSVNYCGLEVDGLICGQLLKDGDRFKCLSCKVKSVNSEVL